MQKKKWVRVSLAVVIVGGAFGAMSAAGCSGDDTSGPGPKTDGGKDSSVNGDSGPMVDSSPQSDTGLGTDADAGKPPNAKVYIVHAAADPLATPLRFCFGVNPTDAGTSTVTGSINPFPDFVTVPGGIAGLYPGFGGSTASSPALKAFDLSILTIELYAIDATQISQDTADGGPDGGPEVPCEKLIGSDGLGAAAGGGTSAAGGTLVLNKQFWSLGTIGSGTLNHGETWVAAVTGCFPGEDANEADFCPTSPAYSNATGNLSFKAWQLDNSTAVAADAGIGAQFGNASPAWDTVNAQAGGVTTAAGFWIETLPVTPEGGTGEDGGDAGDAAATDGGDSGATDAGAPGPTLTLLPITGTGTYGTLSPAKLATVPVPLNVPTAGFFSAFIGGDAGAIYFPPGGCQPGVSCASPFLLPLPAIDQITNGTVTSEFVNGKGYAFILVGDPLDPTYINPVDGGAATSTTGVFNGKSAHFLGFPTSNP
ncbi:MAG TPA: hypothetical protein VIJ22_14005 [Polyangiaceae bacterium]